MSQHKSWRHFWKGVASINIFGMPTGLPERYKLPPQEADRAALREDWESVGRDLQDAMYRFERDRIEQDRSEG